MDAFPFLSGKYYLLTRRTFLGRHRLRPTKKERKLFVYLAVYFANVHGIEIYALTVLNTHYHMVVRDVDGNLPDFLRDFHNRVAYFFNRMQGDRRGAFWDPAGRVGRARIEDADGVLRKLLYTVLNPVKDGICAVAQRWPGMLISPLNIGDTIRLKCPKLLERYGYGDVEHKVRRPWPYRNKSNEQARREFARAVRLQQKLIRKRRNKPFLGVQKALATPIDHQSPPPPKSSNPIYVTRNKPLMRATLKAHERFLEDHMAALHKFQKGDRNVIWPAGTWAKHRLYGCPRHPT